MTVTFADVVGIVGLITQLLVVAGVGIAVKQLIDQNRQQHRDFENMYVQRYWTIVDRLSAEYVLQGKRQELSESDTLACHAYLQLCEDEVDPYELGASRRTRGRSGRQASTTRSLRSRFAGTSKTVSWFLATAGRKRRFEGSDASRASRRWRSNIGESRLVGGSVTA